MFRLALGTIIIATIFVCSPERRRRGGTDDDGRALLAEPGLAGIDLATRAAAAPAMGAWTGWAAEAVGRAKLDGLTMRMGGARHPDRPADRSAPVMRKSP